MFTTLKQQIIAPEVQKNVFKNERKR